MAEENQHNIPDELLARFLAGESTPEETDSVQTWLAESPTNQKVLDDFKVIWEQSAGKTSLPKVDVDAGWAKLNSRINEAKGEEPIIRTLDANSDDTADEGKFAPYAWLIRVAALVAVAFGLMFLFRLSGEEATMLAFQTGAESQTISLADGSVITLNANSTLNYPIEFDGDLREVILTGEAFFDVVRNETMPFIIHAQGADVRVLGTSFNVKAYKADDAVEVAVASGKVALEEAGSNPTDESAKRVILEAGNKGEFNKKENQVTKQESMGPVDLYWKSKTLVFEKTKLSKVAEVLLEVYGVEVEFSNAKLGRCKLSTTFKDEPIENVLEVISATFGLELAPKGENRYQLIGDEC